MRKIEKKTSIFLLILFFTSFSIIPLSQGYYGDGDCDDYHTGKVIKLPYDPNANIYLDGIPSEAFWDDPSNIDGKTQINLSTMEHEIITLNITFIRNAEYLFILCKWPDYTTRPAIKDAVYFCWNINVPNFTAFYPSTMETDHMGGGYIDSWSWSISDDEPVNQSDYYCNDDNFGSGGDETAHDLNDIKVGYTTEQNSHYTLEMSRKLKTIDPENCDVQFSSSKLYEFNLGIINDSQHGQDHAISYTHTLDIYFKESEPIINGFPLSLLIIGISILSLVIIIFNRKKCKKKIQ